MERSTLILLPAIFVIFFAFPSCQEKMSEAPEIVVDTSALLGEGALWDPLNNHLLWIDIEGKQLNIYHPQKKENKAIPLEKRIGTVVPADENHVLVALEDGIYELDIRTGRTNRKAEPEPNRPDNRFNDGKCDPSGRFWAGTMSLSEKEKQGALYRIDPDFTTHKMIDSISISNGIAWSLDATKMYYIDTPTKTVVEYQYNDQTGDITDPRQAILIPDSLGFPDGSTLDAEGMLWIAMWNGHCVTRWNPATGELLEKIDVPALNVTSCAFGGEELDVLYVTSASVGMNEQQARAYPHAGKVFALKPGVKGIKANVFGQ